MTTTSIHPVAGPKKLTAKLAYWDDWSTPDLPESLDLELTADEVAAICAARSFLSRNPAVRSVNVNCTPPEIESWRYDVSYIIVFRGVGSYLFLQGKYDCSQQVEYSVEV